MKEGLKVAVIGATGLVGQQLLSLFEERKFPVADLSLFASSRSVGKVIPWKGRSWVCQELKQGCFAHTDLVFFDASDRVSEDWVPHACEAGAWVIDLSSVFRLNVNVPLIVPEINGDSISKHLMQPHARRLFSGPNCVVVPLALVLHSLEKKWGLNRVIVSTYQSTSGAGMLAMKELSEQSHAVLNQQPVGQPKIFPHSIAFNCIPHIGQFQPDGSTSEEQKILQETRKLLGLPDLKLSVTAVRVPTFFAHGQSVYVELKKPFELEEVRKIWDSSGSGVRVQDDPQFLQYPLGVAYGDAADQCAYGKDQVDIGRLRKDPTCPEGLSFWLVADNLRKGAALNGVQLGEILLPFISDARAHAE